VNKLLLPTLLTWAVLVAPSAWALPGHSLQQEQQWASQNEFLLQLQESRDKEGLVYSSERVTGKGTRIRFEARINEKQTPVAVRSETIHVFPSSADLGGKNPETYFDSNHRSIFTPLMSLVYGTTLMPYYNVIESDVRLSTPESLKFYYRGRKYGYVFSLNEKKSFSVTVYDIQDYQAILVTAKTEKKNQPVDINLFGG
jgi:hypothetical protein